VSITDTYLALPSMKCLQQSGTANDFTFPLQEMSDLLAHMRSFLVRKEFLKARYGRIWR